MRTLIVSTILILFLGVQLFIGAGAKNIIDGDGNGYYAYLPTIFHFKTTDFNQVFEYEKSQKSLSYSGHYFHREGNVLINKYYLGTALAIAPFYMAASMYSTFFGMPTDGYNILYQIAVAFAAAFYLVLGIFAIIKLLQLFDFKKHIALLVSIVLFFGTNLFYYVMLHPSHSHVYSFAAIALFLLFARKFFLTLRTSDLIYASAAFGFVALIRPTNMLILGALPFIAGDRQHFKAAFFQLKSHLRLVFISAFCFMVFPCIQFIFNYMQTGNVFVWSYKNEGFDFFYPHILDFLFGFRKGFFVYTPVMLAIIPAMYLLFKKSKYRFYAILAFLLAIVFILSSWWNWFYGDSFGMRAMIDFYPLLAILLAISIDKLVNIRRGFVFFLIWSSILIGFNLVQTYQYTRGILHHDSMDFNKYSYVFLRTDAKYKDVLGSFCEPYYIEPEPIMNFSFFNDMETIQSDWTTNDVVPSENCFSGKKAALLNGINTFSPTLVLGGGKLIQTASPVFIKASVYYRLLEPNTAGKALLVYAATNKKNEVIFYKTFKLLQLPETETNVWKKADFGFKVSTWDKDVFQVKVYVWNPANDQFLLDDFKVDFFVTNEI